ncbi:MAG: sigma-70 family RNA polymerase sigma factor [Planctomycetes bacterium]|nr:sigma-70 family RNA polymerase sigma factor [Planctomycetota bacterium]
MNSITSVADLLTHSQPGDDRSMNELLPLVYDELRALASNQLAGEARGARMHTLQPTALVHEAFMRLMDSDKRWAGRDHFMAVASIAMRRVLVDHARKRNADKRGGGNAAEQLTLDSLESAAISGRGLRVVELDVLLTELTRVAQRPAKVAEMRLFGGMELEQIARVLGLARMTVSRDWRVARAWLAAKMKARGDV